MLNFVDDLISSYVIHSLQKLHIKDALLFLHSKEGKNGLTQRLFSQSFASPFIQHIMGTLTLSDSARKSRLDMLDHHWINRRNRKLMTKVLSLVSVVYIAIAYKVSVPVNQTSQPLIKSRVRDYRWLRTARSKGIVRGFVCSNRSCGSFSEYSSFITRFFQIHKQYPKLSMFCDGKRKNRFNEVYSLGIDGINLPCPRLLPIFSFSCINRPLKSLLKHFWDLFVGHFQRNGKSSVPMERKGSFSIKNPCKVLHKLLTLLYGKLHCNIVIIYPQRLNARAQG